jgi:hypothetical protein
VGVHFAVKGFPIIQRFARVVLVSCDIPVGPRNWGRPDSTARGRDKIQVVDVLLVSPVVKPQESAPVQSHPNSTAPTVKSETTRVAA